MDEPRPHVERDTLTARCGLPRPSLVLARHREQVLAIAKANRAVRVRVFGSIARGEDVPGSDIDLLVRLAPGATIFDLAHLQAELEDLVRVHVDVVSEGGLRPGPNPIRDDALDL